jgi:chemotaxis protein methyltransferase WspC
VKRPLIQRWLLEHTPLEPSLLDGAGFDSLIAQRINAVSGGSDDHYLALLERSDEEVELITAAVAVPETWFFRYPSSYRHLAEFLRERLAGADQSRSLAIASVGCAGGEEPYSIAMTALHIGWPSPSVRIEAYDRSRVALHRAEVGEYGPGSIRTELPDYAASFLQHTDGRIRVDPALHRLVRFTHTDVTAAGALPAEPCFDAVFCRNLMIYLSEPARARLLDSINRTLLPNGLLFVGHAEPLLCARAGLRPVPAEHAFCLERATTQPFAPPRASHPVPQVKPLADLPRYAPPARPVAPSVLTRSAPPASLVPVAPVAVSVVPDMTAARELADAGRMQECEVILRAVLAKHGPSADALELLGMVRMAANDSISAKAFFEQAIYLDPLRTAAILQLAMIHERNGDLSRAETYWRRARRVSDRSGEEPAA